MSEVSTNKTQSRPAVSPPPRWRRVTSFLGVAALSCAISILLTIVLLATAAPMRDVVFALTPPESGSMVNFTLLALLVAFVAPLAVLIHGQRQGWLSWRILAAGWSLVIGTMIYLAVDDPVLIMPVTLDELAPARQGDAASYKLMSRYSRGQPQPDLKLDANLDEWLAKLNGDNADTEILRQHRDEIEAGWKEVAVLHDWFAELSALPRIGDLVERPQDPVPPFGLLRTYARYAGAHAQVLALDGHGDEALEILRQLADVSQKMAATPRTLMRVMIGIVLEKMALTRMGYVLDNAATSPAAQAALAATLGRGTTGGAGARRMTLLDYVTFMVPMFQNQRLGDMVGEYSSNASIHKVIDQPLNLLDPLLMNSRATLNLAGDYINALGDRAAQRDFAGMSVLSDKFALEWSGAVPIKNVGGRFMLSVSFPAYSKVMEQYWKEQDALAAMLARLRAVNATPKN